MLEVKVKGTGSTVLPRDESQTETSTCPSVSVLLVVGWMEQIREESVSEMMAHVLDPILTIGAVI